VAKQTNANEVMNERLHSPGMTPGRGSVRQAEAYEVLEKERLHPPDVTFILLYSFGFSPCRMIRGAEADWMQFRMEMLD
jgi:hypothetical protein